MNYIELKKQIAELDFSGSKELRITAITNITLEPYFSPILIYEFSKIGVKASVTVISMESLYEEKYENILSKSDFVIAFIHFETMFPDALWNYMNQKQSKFEIEKNIIEYSQQIYQKIKSHTNQKVIWLGYEQLDEMYSNVVGHNYQIREIIEEINSGLSEQMPEAYFLDLEFLIGMCGIQNAYDRKALYRWNTPYSSKLLELVAEEFVKQYKITKAMTKKCIIIDCDNVLWGGIVSEDGIQNIELESSVGRSPYQDFQRFLLHLYHKGVILCICSKNDEEDVMKVFRTHSGMILKEEHIAVFQVNWEPKVDNIRKIADILNIGLDSMVFVDDSEYEIGSVQEILKEVTPILFHKNTIYDDITQFNYDFQVDLNNVKSRHATYAANVQRNDLKEHSISFEAYLKNLGNELDIAPAKIEEYGRISELSQRANKCTNGTRYTVAELKDITGMSNYSLYRICLKDKFGDLGLIGTIGIKDKELDLYCISCRALGRNIESEIMEYIKSRHEILSFRFESTNKNQALHEYLLKHITI